MEFMDNGDLSKYIEVHKLMEIPISEEELWNIFIQSMESLTYVHSKGLIHRDIKPANLFMTNDGVVKLGDFGVSAIVNSRQEQTRINQANAQPKDLHEYGGTVVGTPAFMPPEMMNNLDYDQKADVYSMGVAFYQLCYYDPPRAPVPMIGGNNDPCIQFVDIPKKFNKNVYSRELDQIINMMIDLDPKKRVTSGDALDKIKQEYSKKYIKNTGLDSVLRCLFVSKFFSNYFTKPNIVQRITKNAKQIKWSKRTFANYYT